MYPEMTFVDIGQFQNGILEIDDDEKAQVILNHYQFGGVFFLQDDKGQLHDNAESYLKATGQLEGASHASEKSTSPKRAG